MRVIKKIDAPAADPLDALAAQASQAQAEEAGEAAPSDAAPQMTNAACFAMALEMIRETLCQMAGVESPRRTLSDEKIKPVADALGAVADKYNVALSGMAGNYLVEIKAAMLTIPLALAFWTALKAETKPKKVSNSSADIVEAELHATPA